MRDKETRILNRLLAIMHEENGKPFPVGPFTARWARAWHWYYEVVFRNQRGNMMGVKRRKENNHG